MKQLLFGSTQNIFVQFFRYFWVGASSAVVDLAIFSALIYGADMPWLPAAIIGYSTGIVWNYIISIVWVFKSANWYKELAMVFAIGGGGLLLTWLLLFIFIDLWNWQELIAKMTSQVLILAWNFGLRRFVVFNVNDVT